MSAFRQVLIGHGYPGHTLHTPRVTGVVPVSGHGHDRHTPRVTARSRSSHGRHTPRVTARSRSSHGQHTPRVTARTQSQPSGHTPHTPRVTVVVPVSQQRSTQNHNKNQRNEKQKNTKTNYLSHTKTDDPADSLPVANKLSAGRIPLSQELNSPVPLSVANKKTEDSHPDDKWLMDALIKTTKCQSAVREIHPSGQTPHTPRVTEVVPVSGHIPAGHTLHTPRVTVVVPVSHHSLSGRESLLWSLSVVTHHLVTPFTLRESLLWSLSVVTTHILRKSLWKSLAADCHAIKIKINRTKNIKMTKTNYRSHINTNDLADSLPVANKLPVSRIPLSQELNSPVSLSVANKKTEDRHPDDKWLKDALIKTVKCQPTVRDISGHTLHTPRVTVVVPVSDIPGHTLHTPRVTVVVPVSSLSPHTPRVTVGVPDSGLARQQNKNKQNVKHKNHKANYLSNVTVVDNVKLTKWFNYGHGSSGHTTHTP